MPQGAYTDLVWWVLHSGQLKWLLIILA